MLQWFPSGRGKAQEVLLRTLKIGGPKLQTVLALAAVWDDKLALLTRAVVGGVEGPEEVPEQCINGTWHGHVMLGRAFLAKGSAQEAVHHLRIAQVMCPSQSLQHDIANATRLLAPRDADEEEEPIPNPPPQNPFLLPFAFV